MKIPVTKVYLNNEQSQQEFYGKWKSGLEEFLESYADKITHLKVHTLRAFMDAEEVKFFKRLTKLECLFARNLVYYETLKSTRPGSPDLKVTPLPDVFTNLKSIDFGFEDVFEHQFLTRYVITSVPVLMPSCHSTLESVSLPFSPFLQGMEDKAREQIALNPDQFSEADVSKANLTTLKWCMEDLLAFISGELNSQQTPPKMKRISFEHFYYLDRTENFSKLIEFVAGEAFLDLATKCFELGVKLEKVNSAWFCAAFMKPHGDYGKAVTSMVNIHPCAISAVQLDNLEELVINTSRSCNAVFQQADPRPRRRPEWRKLETLKINQDSIQKPTGEAVRYPVGFQPAVYLPQNPVKHLFEFLFDENASPFQELKQLSLEFKDIPGVYVVPNRVVDDMVRCCGSVRKIELTNWTGMNKGVMKLFSGMQSLEEVVIRNCKNVGNVAFVGADAANPVFLGLKRMKKLSLLGLDKMPKLTDLLFRLVISQVTISHLVLSSEGSIENVTQDGIRSLLNGPFADSIVKFPFEGWSLKNCSSDEFLKLSREFRSSNMI